MRDGIQLSEAITEDGAAVFRHACSVDLRHRFKARRVAVGVAADTGMVEDEEPEFERTLVAAPIVNRPGLSRRRSRSIQQ